MSMTGSGQKFIGINRGPRVHIEYEVDVQGNEKKVQLPFVNGVIADLSGDNRDNLPPVSERDFMEIDRDNFNDRLRAIAPFVDIHVPNKLTGQGEMELTINFLHMDDFSPGAVAQGIEPLRDLLDARNKLANLMTYMDGKSGAEALVTKLLSNFELMNSLSKKISEDHEVESTAEKEEGE